MKKEEMVMEVGGSKKEVEVGGRRRRGLWRWRWEEG